MTDVLWVKAGSNGPVIVPASLGRVYDAAGVPLEAIGDQPTQVPNHRFYRRRLAVGDLIPASQPAPPAYDDGQE